MIPTTDSVFWSVYSGENSAAKGGPWGTEWVMSRALYAMDAPNFKPDQRVQPYEVSQGSLNNCWLYDAMQILTRIGLITAPGVSKTGVYKVTMFDKKTQCWKSMFVDDRLPAYKTYDYSMGGTGKANTTAIFVFVKAIAKWFGAMESLDGSGDTMGIVSFGTSGRGLFIQPSMKRPYRSWGKYDKCHHFNNKRVTAFQKIGCQAETHLAEDYGKEDPAKEVGIATDAAGCEKWYQFYHKRFMYKGGSGDVKFQNKAAWAKGFTWTALHTQSNLWDKKWVDKRKSWGHFSNNHKYATYAVEKLKFSECPEKAMDHLTNNDADYDKKHYGVEKSGGSYVIHAIQLRNPWRSGDNEKVRNEPSGVGGQRGSN